MVDKKREEEQRVQEAGLTVGRVANIINQGVESTVAGAIALPALVTDGYVNIFRFAREKLGGQAFQASNLYGTAKDAVTSGGRAISTINGTPDQIIGPQNKTEEKILFGAELVSGVLLPLPGAAAATNAAKTTVTVAKAPAAQTAARIEPYMSSFVTKADDIANTARTATRPASQANARSVDNAIDFVADTTARGPVKHTFDARTAAATGTKPATGAADNVTVSAADKAAKAADEAKIAAEKAANALDEIKSGLNKKATAGYGERAQNAINQKFADGNILTQGTAKTIGFLARKGIENWKTSLFLGSVGTAGAAAALDSDEERSFAYRTADKWTGGAFGLGRGAIELAARAVSIIDKDAGKSVIDWGKRAIPSFFAGALDVADDVGRATGNRVAAETGVDPDRVQNLIMPRPARRTRNIGNLLGAAGDAHSQNGENQSTIAASPEGQDAAPESGILMQDGKYSSRDAAARALTDKLAEAFSMQGFMKDPDGQWNKIKAIAKDTPGMSHLNDLIELGDQYPMMKYGIMIGAGLGFVNNFGSSKKDMMKGMLGGALAMGIMLDIIGFIMGKPSALASAVMGAKSAYNTIRSAEIKTVIRSGPNAVPERGVTQDAADTPDVEVRPLATPTIESRPLEPTPIISEAAPSKDFQKGTTEQVAAVNSKASNDAAYLMQANASARTHAPGGTPLYVPRPNPNRQEQRVVAFTPTQPSLG